jgi:hypothetical protein
LPLIAYQLYKLLPFASINWSLKEVMVLYPSELFVLTFILFIASAASLFWQYRKKLCLFDLLSENSLSTKRITILGLCALVLMGPLLIFMGHIALAISGMEDVLKVFFDKSTYRFNELFMLLLIVIPLLLILCLIRYYKIPHVALRSFAQGQLINLSFLLLSLSLYSFLYLGHLESKNVQEDRLFNSDIGFSSVEVKVTNKLKQQMLSKPISESDQSGSQE